MSCGGLCSPYGALRPSPEAAAALKTPQLSFVSDDSAMEVPLGMRSAGSASGSPLVQQQQQVGAPLEFQHYRVTPFCWLKHFGREGSLNSF